MLKVLTLVGTRPELIKLSLVISELDLHTSHTLVHSGQNYDYELNEVFFRDLNIRRPDHFLEAAEKSAAATISRIIERFDAILDKEKPDAVLILGDTNSCLGVIAAKKRRIPIFHMEAGNRCFDERVPEEMNRRIVDHVSDINLVYTEHARRYLLNEGRRPDTVIKTGSPMREILAKFSSQIESSGVLTEMKLGQGEYLIVSAHREENVDDKERLSSLLDGLKTLAGEYRKRLIFSTHPRTRTRCEEMGLQADKSIEFVNALGFFDYIKLQQNAFCVVSDSGTLTEESSILGFPAIMIREAHERPEGMDEGTTVMTGLSADRMIQAVRIVTGHDQRTFASPPDYDPVNVSRKVVRIILSYTDFVRRTVWFQT